MCTVKTYIYIYIFTYLFIYIYIYIYVNIRDIYIYIYAYAVIPRCWTHDYHFYHDIQFPAISRSLHHPTGQDSVFASVRPPSAAFVSSDEVGRSGQHLDIASPLKRSKLCPLVMSITHMRTMVLEYLPTKLGHWWGKWS